MSKYLTSATASLYLSFLSIPESILGLPLSVLGPRHPYLLYNLSAICFLLPGLKCVILSFNLLPVLSDQRSSVIGGNISDISSSIKTFSISKSCSNLSAASTLKPIPLHICSAIILATLCSSLIEVGYSSRKPDFI